MSHRHAPARSSRPQTEAPPPRPTLAAPKPVRPAQSTLRPPAPQWTGQPSPPSYTSFPPPPSPAPSAGAGGPPPPREPSASPQPGPGARMGLRSPGPNALTSFPPPPPTPPQTGAPPPGAPPKKTKAAAPTAARIPPNPYQVPAYEALDAPEKTTRHVSVSETELRPGEFDIDNLEETLHNLRFAPSPMLSTIYSVPSTPDFTASTTSCFTPPSTNPTPEPLVLSPRAPPPAEPLASPTRQRSNSRRASPPTRKRGRGVVACIDSPATFATTWYAHPTAPDFPVCSRCYEDHLAGTRLESDFRGRVCDDGRPRACRFGRPRVRDHLLQQALITGRVDDLVAFLRRRSAIPDCKGIDGARGSEGTRWFRPKHNAVPGMLVCEACYEDRVQPFRAAANFEPVAAAQPADAVWACGLAVPAVRDAYKALAADAGDWVGFASEAAARVSLPPCARRQKVHVGSRAWFAPAAPGLDGVLVCGACHADHVARSGEEHRWRPVAGDLASRYGSLVSCALGAFNLSVAMARARETGDSALFWRALDAVRREAPCDPRGVADGRWFTFPSHPASFGVCAACVAAVVEPLGLASSLVPKCGVPEGATLVCALNPSAPRFGAYLARLAEGFFHADARPLEAYALEFASLPPCPRDEDAPGRRWHGWSDCAVCPSCYHEFARGTPLAAGMPLKGEVVAASLMCEMYSPRMRGLYADACARAPPDAGELREAARARRGVYAETVPVIRQMLIEAGTAGGSLGGMREVSVKNAFVGDVTCGSANRFEMQYGKQVSSGTRGLVIGQLERRWREVE